MAWTLRFPARYSEPDGGEFRKVLVEIEKQSIIEAQPEHPRRESLWPFLRLTASHAGTHVSLQPYTRLHRFGLDELGHVCFPSSTVWKPHTECVPIYSARPARTPPGRN